MDDSSVEVPDFSGDDFINDKEIQRARKEAQAYKKLIEDSVAIVKSELSLQESSHKNFKKFQMFKGSTATILDSYASSRFPPKLIVSIAEYRSSYATARYSNSGIDKYFFGYMETVKEFPPTYICKESIGEKIVVYSKKPIRIFPSTKNFPEDLM